MPETNSFLDDAENALSKVIGIGNQGVALWSSFLDSKLNYKLGQAQLANVPNSGSFSPEQEDVLKNLGLRSSSIIVYAAIALAVVGTGVLIWKQVK